MGLMSWLPQRQRPRPATTTTVLFGDVRTGRIYDTLDVTGCSWQQVINDAGRIDGVIVEGHEVRKKKLRQAAHAARTFLAVDVDGVIQEAGPIWSRPWDDERQQLTLGANGLWSLFDHRKALDAFSTGQRVQDSAITLTGADFGGIGYGLLLNAVNTPGGSLPLYAAAPTAGARTETFPGWQLMWIGDQLRQLTKRQNGPDIRFRPTYSPDRLSVQWWYEAGTEERPLLTQVGDDWFFDASVPKSPVVNIHTDEDATVMGMRSWVTGEGQEQDILMASAYDPTLVDAGWPLLEVDETRSTVSDQATLDGHAANLRDRSARPIEVWKVVVRAEAAAQVQAGDYARVIPRRNHPWLGDGEAYMRIKSKSGDMGSNVTLEMYAVQAAV